jgi:hypothetical protein
MASTRYPGGQRRQVVGKGRRAVEDVNADHSASYGEGNADLVVHRFHLLSRLLHVDGKSPVDGFECVGRGLRVGANRLSRHLLPNEGLVGAPCETFAVAEAPDLGRAERTGAVMARVHHRLLSAPPARFDAGHGHAGCNPGWAQDRHVHNTVLAATDE